MNRRKTSDHKRRFVKDSQDFLLTAAVILAFCAGAQILTVTWGDWPWDFLTIVSFACLLLGYVWMMSYRDNRRQRRSQNGLCQKCGYDLRGSSPGRSYVTCPECGLMQARSTRR